MDTMETILSRRSIRKYTSAAIPEPIIQSILRAAMNAPSAGNEQPWQFVVIQDRSMLEAISKVHPYASMLTEAPVAILICGDLELEKHKGFWTQDCSAATQNMLLAIHSYGLGGVWLGIYPREDRCAGIQKLLNLPSKIMPFALVPMGYPAETKPKADRYSPSRVKYDHW